jgi:hypothetical protein
MRNSRSVEKSMSMNMNADKIYKVGTFQFWLSSFIRLFRKLNTKKFFPLSKASNSNVRPRDW